MAQSNRTRASRSEKWSRLEKLTLLFTAVIAAANILLWIETYRSTNITQRTFEATNRPYVGILSIPLISDSTNKRLLFYSDIKNYGMIPATDLNMTSVVLINGITQPSTRIPDKPSVLFPQEIAPFGNATITGPLYSRISDGTDTVEYTIKITYKAEGKRQYCTFSKNRYAADRNAFIRIETIVDTSECL